MEIGRRIARPGEGGADPVDAILEVTRGRRLFEGKVTAVQRDLTTGFVRGNAQLEGIDSWKGSRFTLEFQNEYLAGFSDDKPAVMVPDLIATLDRESARPVTTESLKYGQRVVIIGMPCAPVWRTEAGLALAGPRYFKYDLDYIPLERLVEGWA
jgi:hypothetical protein